jgi:hypothetical protein
MHEDVDIVRRAGKALLRGGFLALVVFGPMIVGMVQPKVAGYSSLAQGAGFGFLLGVLWIISGSSSERPQKIVIVIVSCLLSATFADLAARPLTHALVQPDELIDWPRMPLVRRYYPNVRFDGIIHGEFTGPASMARYREYKEYAFVTDRFGFRNAGTVDEPLDVIVLGDSYGMGDSTTQDKTWSSVLSKQYGLRAYNLAVAGDGPWMEFTNLGLEIDRLKRKPRGTVVLWMIFTGNDLTDPCYPIFRKAQLPWRSGLAELAVSYGAFRARSPLALSLSRIKERRAQRDSRWEGDVIAKKFPDGTDILFRRSFVWASALSADGVRDAPNYDCLRGTIAAMRSLAESKNLAVAIMQAPPKEEVYSWVLHGARPWSTAPSPSGFAFAVREIAREERIPFLDLKPLLVEASKRAYRETGQVLWWRDDAHWNVRGSREVAKMAYEFLTSLRSGEVPH